MTNNSIGGCPSRQSSATSYLTFNSATGNGSEPTVFVASTRNHLIAYSLTIDEDVLFGANGDTRRNVDADPDNLLPEEPSFKLEKCWTINLDDIESVRSQEIEEDDNDDEKVKM